MKTPIKQKTIKIALDGFWYIYKIWLMPINPIQKKEINLRQYSTQLL